jgi:DNA-binding beta-propeller fold protein YncE
MVEMTLDGKEVREWGKGLGTGPEQFTHPLSCCVDRKQEYVYIVEFGSKNDRCQKFKADGTYVKGWGTFGTDPGQFRRASGVTVMPDGRIVIADAVNHRIQIFDAEGTLLTFFGTQGTAPGELNFPYDVASDSKGRLFIAEFNNHRVSVFEPDGKFIAVLGTAGGDPGQFWSPWGLTVDSQDRLLVGDTANQRIQILDLKTPEAEALLKKK